MAIDESLMGPGLEYRSVLVKEIRMHRAYSRVAALTGLGLIGLGLLVGFSNSDLGLLVDLVGILRAVSAIYDIGRKDQLQKSLERIEGKTRA
jgi:hypothetical protein